MDGLAFLGDVLRLFFLLEPGAASFGDSGRERANNSSRRSRRPIAVHIRRWSRNHGEAGMHRRRVVERQVVDERGASVVTEGRLIHPVWQGQGRGGDARQIRESVRVTQFSGASRDTSRGTKQSELVESARVGEARAR